LQDSKTNCNFATKSKNALRMNKKILILLTLTMLFATHQSAQAQDVQKVQTEKTQIEAEQQAVSITVSESAIHVKNAEKQILEIYNLAGVKVNSIRIDSADKVIEIASLPKGCYILKVGKTVRKCYLK
jgi:hypothetical protein